MKGSYEIYPEQSLAVYKIEGVPQWQEIKALWHRMFIDPRYRNDYRGIGDWLAADRGMERSDINDMIEFVETTEASRAQWVIIVDQPLITAYAGLYKEMAKAPHSVEICCTTERASTILGFDVNNYLL